jgi:hypothetical protein
MKLLTPNSVVPSHVVSEVRGVRVSGFLFEWEMASNHMPSTTVQAVITDADRYTSATKRGEYFHKAVSHSKIQSVPLTVFYKCVTVSQFFAYISAGRCRNNFLQRIESNLVLVVCLQFQHISHRFQVIRVILH